ncbi:SGNH/GDSL hydrolase family protein [Actinomadura sp. NPDC048394]|uniref:SGNH/GDSL hydrolase family protein n=1 Tax=Actinomadura sp. NPDC048394 TaxID=3158223 RepID=UPI0033D76C96
MDLPLSRARLIKIAVGMAVIAALTAAAIAHAPPSRRSVSARSNDAVAPGARWTSAWGAAVQAPVAGNEDSGPNWSVKGFAGQTVRQVVRVGLGGTRIRVRLSNAFGTSPLRIAGATAGRSAGGALVWPKTIARVTFAGSPTAVIPPGRDLVSDPVALPASPLERLAITLRFTAPTGPATFHRFAGTDAFRAPGDHLADVGADAFKESTSSWYYLTGVEVAGVPARGSVVVFGDSLVDGVGATKEADARFPDDLQERLVAARRPLGVVNAGIGSNKLLNGSPCGGEKGTSRFARDVLARPGVRSVIVHLGANDIGAPQVDDPCIRPNPQVSARRLIDGHRALIRAAHAHGVKAIGMTLPPMKGALFPFWTPKVEKLREELNRWIRTSHEYDAVIDADRAMSDPSDQRMPRPGYVFMDGLHPNDAGYQAIADAIDLAAL